MLPRNRTPFLSESFAATQISGIPAVGILGALQTVAAEDPLRERLSGRLIRISYRAAIEAFQG
ncbi:hypothetical protein FCH28_00945 [Streptomyces piniterrae]|uniref:Uncharacterized protein n=1 Tax=Streptomyces piniterrae TaxID=2571125 RepID=A0A4U0NW00_9ACTN|nr:hypothetical protein [Streptomyces piniterrae]TJZ58770.1 hypothetical protein FCH28_00945 [Streptomyces piniterrae]